MGEVDPKVTAEEGKERHKAIYAVANTAYPDNSL